MLFLRAGEIRGSLCLPQTMNGDDKITSRTHSPNCLHYANSNWESVLGGALHNSLPRTPLRTRGIYLSSKPTGMHAQDHKCRAGSTTRLTDQPAARLGQSGQAGPAGGSAGAAETLRRRGRGGGGGVSAEPHCRPDPPPGRRHGEEEGGRWGSCASRLSPPAGDERAAASGGRGAAAGGCTARSWGDLPIVPPRPPPPPPSPAAAAAAASPLARREAREACAGSGAGAAAARSLRAARLWVRVAHPGKAAWETPRPLGGTLPPPAATAEEGRAGSQGGREEAVRSRAEPAAAPPAAKERRKESRSWGAGAAAPRPSPRPRASFVRGAGAGAARRAGGWHGGEERARGAAPTVRCGDTPAPARAAGAWGRSSGFPPPHTCPGPPGRRGWGVTYGPAAAAGIGGGGGFSCDAGRP